MKPVCKVCGIEHDGHRAEWCAKCTASWERADAAQSYGMTVSGAAEWGARRRMQRLTRIYGWRKKS